MFGTMIRSPHRDVLAVIFAALLVAELAVILPA